MTRPLHVTDDGTRTRCGLNLRNPKPSTTWISATAIDLWVPAGPAWCETCNPTQTTLELETNP